MSERYAICQSCKGGGCWGCDETGYSGDTIHYPEDGQNLKWSEPVTLAKKRWAMELAILAVEKQMQKYREKEVMSIIHDSKEVLNKPKTGPISLADKFGFTAEQMDLVRRTVAKNADDDELELFFYRCKALNLNPLMPGQIYFLKYWNKKENKWNPGTIVTGIDGFRTRAHATGQLSGIKRGVIRDNQGRCIGAWVDLYRKDWAHPVHEETALSEYTTGYGNWAKMPETMIKKVCEAAALRMAFPNEMGGLYINEEMDQAEKGSKEVVADLVVTGPSKKQVSRLYAIAKEAGVDAMSMFKKLQTDYKIERMGQLTIPQYEEICMKLQDEVSIKGSYNQIPRDEASVSAPKEEFLPDPTPEVPEIDEAPPAPEAPDVPWAKYRDGYQGVK